MDHNRKDLLMRRFLAVAGLLAALTLVASPAQAASSFTVRSTGDYVAPAAANINGTATCAGGTGLLTFTTLVGTPYTVSGQRVVVCDGAAHDWAATIVGGPWAQGQAIIFRAALTAPSGNATQIPKVVLR